jgi:TetR/AcrR family fatty acid metabolism transcriptional regulator
MKSEQGHALRRQQILDAAVIEIAQHGYYQTTIAMIARRAGVADGTIYLYFRSKQEILISIFDRAVGRFIEEGQRQLRSEQGAEAKLRRIMELHLSLVGKDRDLAVIFQVELRHSLHFLNLFSRRRIREYLEIIAEVVREGQAEGSFRSDLEPLLTAKAIFGVLDEMAIDWILSSRNTRLVSKAPQVLNLLLGGMRPT